MDIPQLHGTLLGVLHRNQISWSWKKLPTTATCKWKLTGLFYFLFHPVAPLRLAASETGRRAPEASRCAALSACRAWPAATSPQPATAALSHGQMATQAPRARWRGRERQTAALRPNPACAGPPPRATLSPHRGRRRSATQWRRKLRPSPARVGVDGRKRMREEAETNV